MLLFTDMLQRHPQSVTSLMAAEICSADASRSDSYQWNLILQVSSVEAMWLSKKKASLNIQTYLIHVSDYKNSEEMHKSLTWFLYLLAYL